MMDIGGPEVLLILVLGLLLFGPRKLPEIGRTIGRAMGQLRRAATDFRLDLEREVKLDEFKKTRDGLAEARREVKDTVEQIGRLEPDPVPGAREKDGGAATE